MSRDAEIGAIRGGVAWTTAPGCVALRLAGPDAAALIDRAVPLALHLRDGEVRPSLLLDEAGRVIADVYVGRDDDALLLIAEGIASDALAAHLDALRPAGARVDVEELTREHEVISLHGPYAWELVGELLGPDLVGLPYLAFYRIDDVLCLRGGKTGEYGYDLLVPREASADLRARLADVGAAFDLVEVGVDALDQCMLENGFFNARREGRAGLTPLELGLQWRITYAKEAVGSAALREARTLGATRRVTWFTAEQTIAEGGTVALDGAPIGRVLASGRSATRGVEVGVALVDKPYFHAGIDAFAAAGTPIRTVSPPVVDNRSLFVNAQRHSYATRAEDALPKP